MSKEENKIQVAECLDDKIRGPMAASENAKNSVFKAADGRVLIVADATPQGVIGLDIVRCLVFVNGWPHRLRIGSGSVP